MLSKLLWYTCIFIIKKNNYKQSIYSDYIYNYPDDEISTHKKQFKDLSNNYTINRYNEFCFKKLKKLQRKNKILEKIEILKRKKMNMIIKKI